MSKPPVSPGQLRDGARQFQAAASHLRQLQQQLAAQIIQLLGSEWTGKGQESFQTAWQRYQKDTQNASDALEKTSTVFNTFAADIEQVQASNAFQMITGIGLGLLTVVETAADVAQGGADVATDAATVVTAEAAASAFEAVSAGFEGAEAAAEAGFAATEDGIGAIENIAGDTADISGDAPVDPLPSGDGGFGDGGSGDGGSGGGGSGDGGSGDDSAGGGGTGDDENPNDGSSGDPQGNLSPTEQSIQSKLDQYLLNPDHPVGGPKANWFQRALGFNRNNMGELASQIEFNPDTAVETGVTQYGTKYNQIIDIVGTNGKVIPVTFAWIRNTDGILRLVTAIPTGM